MALASKTLFTKEEILYNPAILFNYPLGNLFQIFGIKDDTCYNFALQLWVRNNLTNWDAVEQISDLCLVQDPECKLTKEIIVEVYKMPEDSEPRKLFKNILSMLMYLAGLVEALRYKETWYVKNWGTTWIKRMPNGRNIQEAMLASIDMIAQKQICYARKCSKYLKEDIMKMKMKMQEKGVIPAVNYPVIDSDIDQIALAIFTEKEEEEIPLLVMKRLKRSRSNNVIEEPHWPQNDTIDKELCGEIISQDTFNVGF